ncbi:hypothetical protein ACIRP2_38235 [Streptomyces sp. NPDC101194]
MGRIGKLRERPRGKSYQPGEAWFATGKSIVDDKAAQSAVTEILN